MNKLIVLFFLSIFIHSLYGQNTLSTENQHIIIYTKPNLYSKIIGRIPINTKVEILGTDMGAGFAFINTQAQTKGWIRMQYLQDIPISQSLEPSTLKKANTKHKAQFVSWLEDQWHSKIQHMSGKKKDNSFKGDLIFISCVIFLIGLLIGTLINPHNKRRNSKTLIIW